MLAVQKGLAFNEMCEGAFPLVLLQYISDSLIFTVHCLILWRWSSVYWIDVFEEVCTTDQKNYPAGKIVSSQNKLITKTHHWWSIFSFSNSCLFLFIRVVHLPYLKTSASLFFCRASEGFIPRAHVKKNEALLIEGKTERNNKEGRAAMIRYSYRRAFTVLLFNNRTHILMSHHGSLFCRRRIQNIIHQHQTPRRRRRWRRRWRRRRLIQLIPPIPLGLLMLIPTVKSIL